MADLKSFIKPYLPIEDYLKFNIVQNFDSFQIQLNQDLIFRIMIITLEILNFHCHFQVPFRMIQDQNSLYELNKIIILLDEIA